jgi:predicted DNA-binding protein with PD1-like motif
MRDALLLDRGERTFVIVFDKGDEVVDGLTAFARRQTLRASQVTAIGALKDVTLGYFDPVAKSYRKIPLREQVEVLSLLGVITCSRPSSGPRSRS